jgi:hypothetical protein
LPPLFFVVSLTIGFAPGAHARQGTPPYSMSGAMKRLASLPVDEVGAIDAAARRDASDAAANAAIVPTKRLETAQGVAVSIDSTRDGTWTWLDDGSRLWRIAIRVAGATDLRLDFSRFALAPGATLHVIGSDDYYQGPYEASDAFDGAFHAPVVPGDTATVELRVPAGAAVDGGIAIARVGAGFRDLFKRIEATGLGASGACNINVVCGLGDPYANEIRAVADYEFTSDDDDNTYLCSGTLIADLPHDRRNYFLGAAHCVSTPAEAASMTLYWNYQSTACGSLQEPAAGWLNDDQHGATLRATRADADFTLVELASTPEPAWHVYYAGWDASGAVPGGTIGIHHPSGDVKKITSGPSPATIDSCIGTGGASHDTHWETGPYTHGTTEGGSSGSGLFVESVNDRGHDRLLIGTLSGGFAACLSAPPTQPNRGTDCYGKLASAWNGASAEVRLRDWLDPAATGALTASGIDSVVITPPTRGHSRHRRPPRMF